MRTKQAKKIKVSTKDRHLAWIDHYTSKDFGIWIECTSCKKWRKSFDYSESHEVPEQWCCSMGTSSNGQKGTCEDPEENSEEEFYEYCPGSLVWARLDGYPWWPGIVDEDPDIEEYFFKDKKGARFYNITFLDERVSHSWIPANSLSSFLNPPPRNSCVQKQYRQNKYSKAIAEAEKRAQTALKMPIKERLKKFSFANLYKGKWGAAEDFDGSDEDDNPHDVIDQLIQEVDDLISINSSDSDDPEVLETDNSFDFLSSEKKLIEHGFDYLKKNNETKMANSKKQSFKTWKDHKTAKRIPITGITKSEKNLLFMESLKNETNNSKRDKTSKILSKKPTVKMGLNKIENSNLKQNTMEGNIEEISNHSNTSKSSISNTTSPVNIKATKNSDDEEDTEVIFKKHLQENDEMDKGESSHSAEHLSPKPFILNEVGEVENFVPYNKDEIDKDHNSFPPTESETNGNEKNLRIFSEKPINGLSKDRKEENSLPIDGVKITSDENRMPHTESDIIGIETSADCNETVFTNVETSITQNKVQIPSKEISSSHHETEITNEEKYLSCTTETSPVKENVIRNADDSHSNNFVIEKSNDILESLGMDKLSPMENETILRHLNECIDDVINHTGEEIEIIPPTPVQLPAKTPKKTSSVTKQKKTPAKKQGSSEQANETEKKVKKNVSVKKAIPKEPNQMVSTGKSTPLKPMTKAVSELKDITEDIHENFNCKQVVKKPVKFSGDVKGPTKEKLKETFPKENEPTIKDNERALKEKKTINDNSKSAVQINQINTGNKIKPDFKSFKRPFKSVASTKNSEANKKLCTEQASTEKSVIEKYSFVELLDNTSTSNSNDILFCKSKVEAKASVLDDKKKEEDSQTETKSCIESSYPNCKKFDCENKENDCEIVTNEGENNSFDEDLTSKNEEKDDCFFFVNVSDED